MYRFNSNRDMSAGMRSYVQSLSYCDGDRPDIRHDCSVLCSNKRHTLFVW